MITSNFESRKIDGAIVWEPTASKLVNAGSAKRVASGAFADQFDGGFMLMDEEFLDTRPDAAKGWLRAELDAQRFLAAAANADEIVRLAQEQTEGFSDQDLRDSLYREWPTAQGGSPGGVRLRLPFVPTGDSAALVDTAAEFLYRIKSIPAPDLPEGAVDPEPATTALDEAGIDPAEGVGAVVAGPGR
ncbi:ABC transporter substrate-binding protein [Nocardia donostiensis]|uniref:Uncharacterized protein n=1 Tax=Nocardia donostiensis TaxID=1538463 RepID=A0A1V2TG47_9NOCA|nr:ABC transporter substrate-binding protein [Nocardia donostiensis]ONM48489.1 hypothetical protein B0T46_12390 [Nocardia donostiensis]OQS18980.1 hypothetical protein B0T44_16580 [Nocardia donostiensis]